MKNKANNDIYALFRITKLDDDGILWARQQRGGKQREFPVQNNRRAPALAVGDEFFGKLQKDYRIKPVSKLATTETSPADENIFGIIERQNHLCLIHPIERGAKPYILENGKNLQNGDLAEIQTYGRGRQQEVSLVKNYGLFTMEKLNQILITRKYKLPHIFDREVLNECRNFPDFADKHRLNLTHLPLVTIDGDDSRDFDDAVYALPSAEGFDLIVAIADVSFYVRPQSALDREACRRGNSVYLPQTVIPMLPEILSNDLCSLNPGVKRPVIACLMKINHSGDLISWDFRKAVIKSAARLTYKETEAALSGNFNTQTKKLYSKTIQPLYEAFLALKKARKKRGALELESTEVKIKFNKDGSICSVEKQETLISHQIIEEFMIAANVAAARCLQKNKLPAMYRIHDRPKEEKLKEIKPLLESLKLKLPDWQAVRPQHFNRILELCRQKDYAFGLDDLILRLQCQAQYSPNNIGHFGLGLKEYVHFTSPIRRYADLLIHRALVHACRLENNPPELLSVQALEETADHLCTTERTAAAAERDITARYLSAYLQPLVGTYFEVTISGLTNAGIFVRIENLGAEGLIPMRSLPKDYYQLLDAGCCLRGTETKQKFRLGQTLPVILSEAIPATGSLIFQYLPEQPFTICSRPNHKKTGKKANKKTKNKKSHSKKATRYD